MSGVQGRNRGLEAGTGVPGLPPRVSTWGRLGRAAAHLANTLVLELLLPLLLLLHSLVSLPQHTIPTPHTYK